MKVAIFGASGGIGKFAVKHALAKGYSVNAYLRDPQKLPLRSDKLRVFKGEITDYSLMKEAIEGCDAVIWCVGVNMKKHSDGMPSLEGHYLLFKAMKECKITHLIDWATTSVKFKNDKWSIITIFPGFFAGILLNQAKSEMVAIGKAVFESGLDWTLVRFVAPRDTPYTGKVKAGFGDVRMKMAISREDIAAFMVEQVESNQYHCSMPIIGS